MIVAIMKQINYNHCADLSLESSTRHMECEQEAPEMGILSSNIHKSHIPNSVYLTFQQSAFFWGFVISAVPTTIDSCLHRQTWKKDRLPVAPRSSLAALVKRLHNLFRQSGKTVWTADKLTRHAHLVLAVHSKDGEGRHSLFLLPL